MTDSITSQTSPSKNDIWRRWFSIILITGTFIWLLWLINRDRHSLSATFSQLTGTHVGWLMLSLIIGAVSVGLTFFVYRLIINRSSATPLNSRSLARLFFASQILRYLPGRVFGVAYQMNKIGDQIPTSLVLRANIEFLVMSMLFNTMAALTIFIFYSTNILHTIIVFCLGLVIIALYIKSDMIIRVLSLMRKILPKKFGAIHFFAPSDRPYTIKSTISILAIYSLTWIAYLSAWQCLSSLQPLFGTSNVFMLSAAYTLASVVGIMSIITPAGLGVREAAFVLISTSMASVINRAALSIFFRFWFICIDLVLFMTISALTLLNKKNVRTR